MSVLDKNIYYSLRKLEKKFKYSSELEMMYKNFDLTAKHFHIEDRLSLTRDIFENWMENNLNPKSW